MIRLLPPHLGAALFGVGQNLIQTATCVSVHFSRDTVTSEEVKLDFEQRTQALALIQLGTQYCQSNTYVDELTLNSGTLFVTTDQLGCEALQLYTVPHVVFYISTDQSAIYFPDKEFVHCVQTWSMLIAIQFNF